MAIDESRSGRNLHRHPKWMVAVLFVVCLFVLVPGVLEIASAQSGHGIDLMCPCPIRIQGNSINFSVTRVENTRATSTGILKLQVWATQTRYTGDKILGHKLAEVWLGQLRGNQRHFFLSYTQSFMVPPAGTYYITVILTEFDRNRRDVIRDYQTLDGTFTFGGGGDIGLVCPCPYRLQGNSISFRVARVENTRTTPTGILKLQVWATQTRYAGDKITGDKLAEVWLM